MRFVSSWSASARVSAVLISMAAALAGALSLMGRRAYCECGLSLFTVRAASAETSQHLLDPYSFSHVLHGILFFAAFALLLPKVTMAWKVIAAAALEIAWEIAENTPLVINRYRDATAALGYTGDSILNSLGDLACAMFGFWLAARLPVRWTVATVVLVELLMLLTIKDNLTLNVVMLLYPVDAIREWQLR